MFGTHTGSRPLSKTIELGEVSRTKMDKIGKPKLVNTFMHFLDAEKEIIQESNTQLIITLPKDVFETNQDLKNFFDERVAKTICIAQTQILSLKVIGQIGGVVKTACKGQVYKLKRRLI